MGKFLLNSDTLIFLNNESDKIFGISPDTIFSILITLFIFFVGFFIQVILEKWKETKRLRTLENYIFVQLEELVKDLEIGINNLNLFLDEFNKGIHQNYVLNGLFDFHYKNIIAIIQTDKYKIFVLGRRNLEINKIKSFDNLEKSIFNIEILNKNLGNDFNFFMARLNKFNFEWGDNIQMIHRLLVTYIQKNLENNVSIEEDLFLKEYNSIFRNWATLGAEREMNVVKENILDPLLIHVNNFKKDTRSVDVSNHIVNCLKAYEDMKNLRTFYKSVFEKLEQGIQDSMNNILKETNYFKNLKKKWIIWKA